jgi:valyl-tRNA synthetase
MKYPVVKLLWGRWGPLESHERNYAVHPDYEDGETDGDGENVGWMYMSVIDYMRYYNDLNEYDWWFDLYARPPDMIEVYERLSGSWGKG